MSVARTAGGDGRARRAPAVRRAGAAFGIAALLAGGALLADRLAPPPLDGARDLSTLVVDRDGNILRAFTTERGGWRLPVAAGDVSPLYLRMLIAYEDRRFLDHDGVDARAVVRAAWQNLAGGEILSGASTLSMQVARLLEPRSRSIGAKALQALRALQLEAHVSKTEVLRLYLTLAPMGGNLEGVRAGSLAWFGKEPRHLTAAEAALLIALPQSPATTRPDRFPQAARKARDKILRRMVVRGVLTEKAAREAMEAPLPTRRRAMPFHAPHLARRLFEKTPDKPMIRTGIDGRLQRTVEAIAGEEAKRLGRHTSVAVLVVANDTGRVLAYVGSAGFFNVDRLGQVDMVAASRSPGSALKPFIYGMGFDRRLIHPQTIVNDAPTRFGGYQPENFLRVYHGEVSIETALQQSLNIPAVAVLDGVGAARFVAQLKRAGVEYRFKTDDGRPGLAIALGGGGISLFDLVTLYRGLANGGRVRPLARTADVAIQPGARFMSPMAAWYLTRILEAAPPPDAKVAAQATRRPHPIAYKTGTSYGFRDAWAVGYDGGYTVGIWVGRADGTPSPGHYGRKTAAPILYRVFDLLPGSRSGAAGVANPSRPDAAIAARSAEDLPANLRRYVAGRSMFRTVKPTQAQRKPLTITFPPNGSVVALEQGPDGTITLPLTADGGRKPLRWLVNGRPVASERHRRQGAWRPDGPGFVRITVIDAEGRTATSMARLR